MTKLAQIAAYGSLFTLTVVGSALSVVAIFAFAH